MEVSTTPPEGYATLRMDWRWLALEPRPLPVALSDPRQHAQWVVDGLAGDDRSHAASRILDISVNARNQMDVRVPDGLTGCLAYIEPDVDAVGWASVAEICLDLACQVENGCLLFRRQRKEIRLMTPGNHEHVSWRHGVRVRERNGEIGRPIIMA